MACTATEQPAARPDEGVSSIGAFSSACLEGSCPHPGRTIVKRVQPSAPAGAEEEGRTGDHPGEQGLGLYAARAFSKGEEVWREAPVLFLQHHYSACVSPACIACGACLGSLRTIFTWMLGRMAVKSPFDLFPRLETCGLLECPALNTLPEPIPCPHGCGALFCSSACRDGQLADGHHRVCCADLPAERWKAWGAFCAHAREQHEHFILAAEAIAQIICDVRHRGQTLETSAARLTQYFARPWHEQVPQGAKCRMQRVESRLERLRASLALLKEALSAPGFEELFQVPFYSSLVGMLDLTCLSLNRSNTLEPVLKSAVDDLPLEDHMELHCTGSQWRALQQVQLSAEFDSSDSEGDEGDEERGKKEVDHTLSFQTVEELTNWTSQATDLVEAELKNRMELVYARAADAKGARCNLLFHYKYGLGEGSAPIAFTGFKEVPLDLLSCPIEAKFSFQEMRPEGEVAGAEEGQDAAEEALEESAALLPEFDGVALVHSVALTNHSCYPNVTLHFEGSCEVRAVAERDISPGEQLLMDYTRGTSESLAVRRQTLWDDYGFWCACPRCRIETFREALMKAKSGDSAT